MTGSELVDQVLTIIQDPSFDTDDIMRYLNDGLVNIASHGMNSTGEIKFDLPDLEAVETVETITTADFFVRFSDHQEIAQ